jgi:DNA repair protein RadC
MNTLTAETPYQLRDTDIIFGEADTQYTLRVRDMEPDKKPREKLISQGPSNLSHAELMAILLVVGTVKEEVMAMSSRILREYGERAIVNERDPVRMAESLQIPVSKACQIIACFELGRRSFQNRAGKPIFVRTSKQAFVYLRNMGELQKEQLRGLYLNSRYEVIHEEIISIGSLTANIVHPREVFQPALEYGAVAVIVAHNHPSGVLDLTQDDMYATNQLLAAGKVLGIDLLDHLIIADDEYVSLIEPEKHENE